MAKKKSYDAYVRQQMGDLIDQLQLPNLHKQSLKERWLDQMIWADKKASQCRRSYYRLRLVTIVGGVILPALVGISVQLGQDSPFFRVWFPPLTFVLSQVIAVSVAVEEFCKFGERWRDYRKMAEDLKSEGWQYLQSSGPYEYGVSNLTDPLQVNEPRSAHLDSLSINRLPTSLSNLPSNSIHKHQKTHLQNYAQFANRIESIIKNDVQSYISDLLQQQAKQDAVAQQALAQAQSATNNKTLIAQLDPGYRDPNAAPTRTPSVPMNPVATHSTAIAGAVGVLRVHQDTTFKLNTQPSQVLPDSQKLRVGQGAAFGLLSYTIADHNHFHVTLNQGLGVENRNSWFVYAPHAEIVGDIQPAVSAPVQPTVLTPVQPAVSAPVQPAVPVAASAQSAAIAPKREVQLDVPYLSQRDNVQNADGSCNVTSIAMCLLYLGVKQKNPQQQFEDELQDWMVAQGLDRHDAYALKQAVEAYGCQDNYTTTATIDQVKQWLDQGNPVVIHGYFTASGHIVCGIGYNNKGLIIHDPYGEWYAEGYDRNDSDNQQKGKALTYSYEMIRRTCIPPDGTFWVHFISRAEHSAPPSRTIQPLQFVQSTTTSRLINLSTTPSNALTSKYITADQLIQIAGQYAPRDRLRELIPDINQTLEKYQITTPLRIAHFLAQVTHESDHFNAMEEYASGEQYEGRDDLGNTEPGDGKRFKGRGLIQLTGRSNYEAFSKAMNQDFVAQPPLVAKSPYAVLVAGWFWDNKKINSFADRDDVVRVTEIINGGHNGLPERQANLQKAKSVLNC